MLSDKAKELYEEICKAKKEADIEESTGEYNSNETPFDILRNKYILRFGFEEYRDIIVELIDKKIICIPEGKEGIIYDKEDGSIGEFILDNVVILQKD